MFNLTDKTPANVPKIDLKHKPEFVNKIFYQPEPIHSTADQAIIDRNAADLKSQQTEPTLTPSPDTTLGK